MKDANRSTHIDTGSTEPKEAPKPPPQEKVQRARPGSSEHHENQRELSIGADHVTDAMRRDKRGTFP